VSAERGLELEAQLREAQKLAADVRKLSSSVDEQVAGAERIDDPPAWDEVEDPFGDTSEAFGTSPDTWSDSPADVEEPVEEEPAGGLSLRERLARAADARRRLS
jgi:hypothetical protein